MEEFAPVGIVETMDGVPKDAEGADGRSCTVGHDGHVMCPVEVFMDEDSKVTNER